MFKYGSNVDPTTVIPGGDFRHSSGERIDYSEVNTFVGERKGYKLINHFQIKYRVGPSGFKGTPQVLRAETSVGTTKNPCGPVAGFLESFPGQYGPLDASRTGPVFKNNRVTLINDGSPDAGAIRAFNTLMGKGTEEKIYWENIGSKLTFKFDGGTRPEFVFQPYPTYYEYYNGRLVKVNRQAPDPRLNFNANPYPFGTVPSHRLGGITPGGRDGDAQKAADATARIPPYSVP